MTFKQIEESINVLIDYDWDAEMKHFYEKTGFVIQSNDDLKDWIITCRRTGNTHHIFYHLMVLKYFFSNEI